MNWSLQCPENLNKRFADLKTAVGKELRNYFTEHFVEATFCLNHFFSGQKVPQFFFHSLDIKKDVKAISL